MPTWLISHLPSSGLACWPPSFWSTSGQERSTRYQNFVKSGWYFPDFGGCSEAVQLYSKTVENLFATYQRATPAVLDALRRRVACPESLKPEAYQRTLRARAFDVARYLLPLATLCHPAAEVRNLGIKLREAATGPAWNVNAQPAAAFVEMLGALDLAAAPDLAAEAANLLTKEVRTARTLVKYAQPNDYLLRTQAELTQVAAELLAGQPIAAAPLVDLVERTETLEVELASTLLYSAAHHSYRQIRDLVGQLPAGRVSEIIELGVRHRGRHDEALRAFHAGAALRFDILMDIGGFRDMHRHRRCTQIIQPFTAMHGYETPTSGDLASDAGPGSINILTEAGVLADYQSAVDAAHLASTQVAASGAPEAPQSALYLLPLATRVRSLFKMDFAEAQYISELRSAPAGHFSYRRVAWEMFLALERQHPSLASYIRVTDFTKPIDLLQR